MLVEPIPTVESGEQVINLEIAFYRNCLNSITHSARKSTGEMSDSVVLIGK